MDLDILNQINQSLIDLATATEKLGDNAHAPAIEQSLSDLVVALEKIAPVDMAGITAAIKGLKLTVNVSPTPIQVNVSPTPFQVNVPAATVQVMDSAFKPLILKVNRARHTELIESIEITEA